LIFSNSRDKKKDTFSPRMLKDISQNFDVWVELLAMDLSGGILVGCDVWVELLAMDLSMIYLKIMDKSEILHFSITVFFTNRVGNFKWCLIVVYGPIDSKLK
jgi:hypothetical protein